MAIAIEATVFVNEVKQLDFGHILKCGHPHRYKAEDGDWTTASTTYLDIIIRNNKTAEFQDFLQLQSGTRIAVKGFGKPTAFEKKDGSLGSTLQLEPTEITVVENKQDADAPF
jgi:hypothetical protein